MWTSAAVRRAGRRLAKSRSEAGAPPSGRVLDPSFFNRDTVEVARDLLGQVLVRELDGKRLWGRLVELEAYLGPEDLAAHSSGGRRGP
ncbi:MAG TPA: DNA-3-methyladenine glycosylase, partial [Myxococcaceae bacterium]|nr:DNA-3-methyladenine glycosylase [Myxococcaceae bacterium]